MTSYRHQALWNIKAFPFPEYLYGLAAMDHFSCRLGWKYVAANASCDHMAVQYKMGNNTPHPKTSALKKRQFASVDNTPWCLVAAP